jgi:serine/threonine protein phosphatase PrpC
MNGQRATAVGAATDKGRVRELNEDRIGTPGQLQVPADLRTKRGVLLAVADGMGGHAAGEVASKEAINTLYAEYYRDPSPDLARSLRRAVEKANARIYAQASSDLAMHGMGTTLVAAVIQRSRLIVANVGDSRAYLVRGGALRQISRDHSWVAESLAAGIITEEQAQSHTYRGLITRALGQMPDVEVDLFQERLRAGDILLLCSDGLTNEVDDARIAQVLDQQPPPEAAQDLVALANQGGGRDNISAVVARVPSGTERLRASPVPALIVAALALIALVGLAFAIWGLIESGSKEPGPGQAAILTATAAAAQPVPSTLSAEGTAPVATVIPQLTSTTTRTSEPGHAPTGPAAPGAAATPAQGREPRPPPGGPVSLDPGWGCDKGGCTTQEALERLFRDLGYAAEAERVAQRVGQYQNLELDAPVRPGLSLLFDPQPYPEFCLHGQAKSSPRLERENRFRLITEDGQQVAVQVDPGLIVEGPVTILGHRPSGEQAPFQPMLIVRWEADGKGAPLVPSRSWSDSPVHVWYFGDSCRTSPLLAGYGDEDKLGRSPLLVYSTLEDPDLYPGPGKIGNLETAIFEWDGDFERDDGGLGAYVAVEGK